MDDDDRVEPHLFPLTPGPMPAWTWGSYIRGLTCPKCHAETAGAHRTFYEGYNLFPPVW
jgi:hypothetical protein